MSNHFDKIIDDLVEGLPDFYPLPDITPLQKMVNSLYMKLRICGMPVEEVSENINYILQKHGITREQLLSTKITKHSKTLKKYDSKRSKTNA